MMHELATRQIVPAELDAVWAFFSDPVNLDRLTPPDLRFRIVSGGEPPLHDGQLIRYRIRLLPLLEVDWLTEIKQVVPGISFIDEQRLGPYRFWQHLHRFEATDDGVVISDTVHYDVGFSLPGVAVHSLWVRPRLERIFAYRRAVIAQLFAAGE